MSTREDETEKSNLDVVKSYYKSLTLQKKYGTTGSIEMENGAVYIGNMFNTVSLDTDWTQCPGDLDENGVRTGMGHLEIPNGSTYDGSFYKVLCMLFLYICVMLLPGPAKWYRGDEVCGQLPLRGRVDAGLVPRIRGLQHHRRHEVRGGVQVLETGNGQYSYMIYDGCTRGGRMWGHGLLTYSDGSPSSEGYFQESKFR